jgi:hypothetical protein
VRKLLVRKVFCYFISILENEFSHGMCSISKMTMIDNGHGIAQLEPKMR